jgi:5-(carboxyamino)imidazole ribonucleotide mutase
MSPRTGTGRPRSGGTSRRPIPAVGVVMGSDSDWPVMQAAAEALAEFGVPYEADVVSAHRMPRDMIEYGASAQERGLRVIIAGAGGAAHLPGMLASVTPLPVIGVPVPLKYLDGLDSLLSIVQMPAGIPSAAPATPACSPSASSPPPTPRPAPACARPCRSTPPPCPTRLAPKAPPSAPATT